MELICTKSEYVANLTFLENAIKWQREEVATNGSSSGQNQLNQNDATRGEPTDDAAMIPPPERSNESESIDASNNNDPVSADAASTRGDDHPASPIREDSIQPASPIWEDFIQPDVSEVQEADSNHGSGSLSIKEQQVDDIHSALDADAHSIGASPAQSNSGTFPVVPSDRNSEVPTKDTDMDPVSPTQGAEIKTER